MDLTGLTKICEGVYKKSETSYYLICSITGEKLYCSKERLDKLIQKHGSIETVGKNTVSRDAKKLLTAKTPVTTITKMSATDLKQNAEMIRADEKKKQEKQLAINKTEEIKEEKTRTRFIYTPQERNPIVIETASKEFIEDLTRYTCWYAAHHIDNGYWCNGCKILDRCIAPCKKIKVEKKNEKLRTK